MEKDQELKETIDKFIEEIRVFQSVTRKFERDSGFSLANNIKWIHLYFESEPLCKESYLKLSKIYGEHYNIRSIQAQHSHYSYEFSIVIDGMKILSVC